MSISANPHVRGAAEANNSGKHQAAQLQARLAGVHEQRTANLIAMIPYWPGDELIEEIKERLTK